MALSVWPWETSHLKKNYEYNQETNKSKKIWYTYLKTHLADSGINQGVNIANASGADVT